jgi:diguanylate cyclase (GGDEF)-like protein/PAS domain S-box-containing protein
MPEPRPASAAHPRGAPALQILLVEDDVVDQLAFKRRVLRDGLPYEIITAGSVATARVRLAAGNIDLIVTDYNLPDGTAFDVAREGAGLPWILVTGGGGEEVAVEALRAGAHDYVVKGGNDAYLDLLRYSIESAARLAQTEARNRLLSHAMTGTLDAVYITDDEGKILFVNPAFERLYQHPGASALGRPESMLWAGEDGQVAGSAPNWSGEVIHMRADGTEVPIWLSRSLLAEGRSRAWVCTARDITERRRIEESLREANEALERSRQALQELAIRDELTGLFNRRELVRLFIEEAARASRFKHRLSLVLIDVDHFKRVNDTYGHAAGDEVLRHLGRLLPENLRSIDRAARLGGEEFALLLPETDLAGAAVVAERLRRRVAEAPLDITSSGALLQVRLTISAGVAGGPGPTGSFSEMMTEADRALYRAKHSGRNRVVRTDEPA